MTQVAKGQELRKLISNKDARTQHTATDTVYAKKQVRVATNDFKGLEAEQKDVTQPQIMAYLKAKHEVAELEKQAGDWKRKLDIAEMELTRTQSTLRKLNTTGQSQLMHTGSMRMSRTSSLPKSPQRQL